MSNKISAIYKILNFYEWGEGHADSIWLGCKVNLWSIDLIGSHKASGNVKEQRLVSGNQQDWGLKTEESMSPILGPG